MISTNSAASLTSLPVLMDYTGSAATDWEQETVDLTPYVGKTVQLVWYYVGLDLGSFGGGGAAPYGWLLDDIGITGVAYGQSGTIVVTKNLSQGGFSLVGGVVSIAGNDLTNTFANLPPGTYTVQFGEVAFYNTPPAQTKDLVGGTNVTFTGIYTFPDVNHNGISDDWEMYYFGEVSTNRTQKTDSDHDGMTDYAEFIAGTDPTNAASKLIFTSVTPITNHSVQIQWAAIPGRSYQVQTSTNLNTWTPISGWLQAASSPMTFSTTNSTERTRLYRVQVLP